MGWLKVFETIDPRNYQRSEVPSYRPCVLDVLAGWFCRSSSISFCWFCVLDTLAGWFSALFSFASQCLSARCLPQTGLPAGWVFPRQVYFFGVFYSRHKKHGGGCHGRMDFAVPRACWSWRPPGWMVLLDMCMCLLLFSGPLHHPFCSAANTGWFEFHLFWGLCWLNLFFGGGSPAQ